MIEIDMRTLFQELREVFRTRTHLQLMRGERLAQMLHFICHPPSDPDLIARTAAECLVRAWLARQQEPWFVGTVPATVVPNWLDEGLLQWLARNHDARLMQYDGPRPNVGEPGASFMAHVETSLTMWNQADGFIPLVLRHDLPNHQPEALPIPFVIRKRLRREDPFIVTTDGSQVEVAGLRHAWDTAWQAAVECHWVTDGDLLQVRLLGLTPAMASLPEGNSATLPFLVAIFLHVRALSLPPLAWAASGDLNELFNGQNLDSRSEAEWQAKEHLIASLGIPEDFHILPRAWHQRGIKSTADVAFMLKELFSSFAIHLDPKVFQSELSAIDGSMRNAQPDLQVLAAELDRLLSSMERHDGPRWDHLRAQGVKLRADLYCHQGIPDRCLDLLPEIADSRSKQTCLAWTRIAVASTDLCRHDECEQLTTLAIDTAEGLEAMDVYEIRLHALGTRGQGRMVKALETGDPEHAQAGLADLQTALELARELDHDIAHGDRQVPRNTTYLLLWYALHRPCEAGDWYRQSLALAADSRHGSGYVLRAAHLARYRAILLGLESKLPWWPAEDPPVPDTAIADGWLAATALKYRGASLAAAGDYDHARSDFMQAAEILGNANGWLLQFIRGTILLQAGESLLSADSNEATNYLTEASGIFEACHSLHQINPDSPVAPDKWLQRTRCLLEGDVNPLINPQMLYPY